MRISDWSSDVCSSDLIRPSRAASNSRQVTAVASSPRPTVFVIDDDASIRQAVREMLQDHGYIVQTYASSEAFLATGQRDCAGCLVVDARLPEMDGLALIGRLKETGLRLPAIMITGNGDVPMAVAAMKAGPGDFRDKPVKTGPP